MVVLLDPVRSPVLENPRRFTPRSIPNLALWLDASQGVKTG